MPCQGGVHPTPARLTGYSAASHSSAQSRGVRTGADHHQRRAGRCAGCRARARSSRTARIRASATHGAARSQTATSTFKDRRFGPGSKSSPSTPGPRKGSRISVGRRHPQSRSLGTAPCLQRPTPDPTHLEHVAQVPDSPPIRCLPHGEQSIAVPKPKHRRAIRVRRNRISVA